MSCLQRKFADIDQVLALFELWARTSIGTIHGVKCYEGESDTRLFRCSSELLTAIDVQHPMGEYIIQVVSGFSRKHGGTAGDRLLFYICRFAREIQHLKYMGVPSDVVCRDMREYLQDCIQHIRLNIQTVDDVVKTLKAAHENDSVHDACVPGKNGAKVFEDQIAAMNEQEWVQFVKLQGKLLETIDHSPVPDQDDSKPSAADIAKTKTFQVAEAEKAELNSGKGKSSSEKAVADNIQEGSEKSNQHSEQTAFMANSENANHTLSELETVKTIDICASQINSQRTSSIASTENCLEPRKTNVILPKVSNGFDDRELEETEPVLLKMENMKTEPLDGDFSWYFGADNNKQEIELNGQATERPDEDKKSDYSNREINNKNLVNNAMSAFPEMFRQENGKDIKTMKGCDENVFNSWCGTLKTQNSTKQGEMLKGVLAKVEVDLDTCYLEDEEVDIVSELEKLQMDIQNDLQSIKRNRALRVTKEKLRREAKVAPDEEFDWSDSDSDFHDCFDVHVVTGNKVGKGSQRHCSSMFDINKDFDVCGSKTLGSAERDQIFKKLDGKKIRFGETGIEDDNEPKDKADFGFKEVELKINKTSTVNENTRNKRDEGIKDAQLLRSNESDKGTDFNVKHNTVPCTTNSQPDKSKQKTAESTSVNLGKGKVSINGINDLLANLKGVKGATRSKPGNAYSRHFEKAEGENEDSEKPVECFASKSENVCSMEKKSFQGRGETRGEINKGTDSNSIAPLLGVQDVEKNEVETRSYTVPAQNESILNAPSLIANGDSKKLQHVTDNFCKHLMSDKSKHMATGNESSILIRSRHMNANGFGSIKAVGGRNRNGDDADDDTLIPFNSNNFNLIKTNKAEKGEITKTPQFDHRKTHNVNEYKTENLETSNNHLKQIEDTRVSAMKEVMKDRQKAENNHSTASVLTRAVLGMDIDRDLIDVISSAVTKQSGDANLRLDPDLVQCYTMYGMKREASLVDGVVIQASLDNMTALQHLKRPYRLLLVNADVTSSYSHLGHRGLAHTRLTTTDQLLQGCTGTSVWMQGVMNTLTQLSIDVVLVKGVVSEVLLDQCTTNKIVVIHPVPYKVLSQISHATRTDMVTYVPLADQDNVCCDVGMLPWQQDWCDRNYFSTKSSQQEVVLTFPQCPVQTVVWSEFSSTLGDLREQGFWDGVLRLTSVLTSGDLVKGQGRMETKCVEFLSSHEDQEHATTTVSPYRTIICDSLSACFHDYTAIATSRGQGQPEVTYECASVLFNTWMQALDTACIVLSTGYFVQTGIESESAETL